MPKIKSNANNIERIVIKIPKTIAEYFRATFPHGKRSEFIARCILLHKHQEEVETMEENLRKLAKKRQ